MDLDSNKDGYIEIYDMLRYFGDENIDNLDLKKLFYEKGRVLKKGSQKSNELVDSMVVLNCSDFTRWVGESIHQREGFYFRHDSIKNPKFEQHVQKRKESMKDNIERTLTFDEEKLYKTLL